jgi:hypothetical protein
VILPFCTLSHFRLTGAFAPTPVSLFFGEISFGLKSSRRRSQAKRKAVIQDGRDDRETIQDVFSGEFFHLNLSR